MLTAHQRIALLRAGIAIEEWSEGRFLLTRDRIGLWIDVRDDGVHDHCSGFGPAELVDQLRQSIRAILDLKYWAPPTC